MSTSNEQTDPTFFSKNPKLTITDKQLRARAAVNSSFARVG
jgi:hypothetical protein